MRHEQTMDYVAVETVDLFSWIFLTPHGSGIESLCTRKLQNLSTLQRFYFYTRFPLVQKPFSSRAQRGFSSSIAIP